MTTIRTRLNSVTTIENAAPWANESASWVYFEISPAPRLSAQSVACFWIWIALQAVGVEPVLEPVDVLLGAGLAAVVRRR